MTPRDRAIGARLAGVLQRRLEPRQIPRVRYELTGSAGQSLGAFAVAGMRIEVTGEANDYVGKGLSGATVVVPVHARARPRTRRWPATCACSARPAGALHLVGRAGMRFAVRNSGARAVVEGIGAHGCEYMTGGTVVVLGEAGANFGAGMTGGLAYLLDADRDRLNAAVVARQLEEDDRTLLELLAAHAAEGSRRAASILAEWDAWRARFVVVEPRATETPATVERRWPWLDEPITERANRRRHRGPRLAKLRPQAGKVRLDPQRVRVRLAPPPGAEQLLVRDEVTARADELLEQRELDRREGQEAIPGPCLVAARSIRIEPELAATAAGAPSGAASPPGCGQAAPPCRTAS